MSAAAMQARAAERTKAEKLKIGVVQECNIFSTAETPRFRLYSADSQVKWSIRDANGAAAGQGTFTIDPQAGSGILQIAKLPAGFYTLTIADSRTTRRAGFAVLDAHTESGAARDSMFGVNSHGSRWDPATYQQAIGALKKIGVRSIRDDNSYWDQVEKEPGKYTFAQRSDAVMQYAKDAGIEPLALLAYGNQFYDGGETPNSDAAIEAAGKYAAAVVQHYGAVPAVEVWNEYYGGFSTGVCKQSPDCYFRLLKSVYLHVKAVSPETKIVAPAAFKVPVDWLSALFERGALEYLDAVSVHPYRSPGRPEGLETDLENLQSLIRKYNHGTPKPIWITEQGWSTQGGHPAGVDEMHQAFYAVRSAVIAQSAGVARNYWYDLLNDGDDANESEQNFGLLRRPDQNADGITPKPAYVAYGVAAQLLGGKKAEGTCVNDESTRCYRFSDERGSIRVAWVQSPQPVNVTMSAAGPIELTDVFGRRRILQPVQGQISVELTESPVYLSGEGELQKADAQGVVGPELGVAVGEPIPLTVYGWDCGRNDEHSRMALLIEGTRYPLSECTSKILMPPQAEPGARTLIGELQRDGHTSGYVAAYVHVVADAVSAHVYPAMTRKGSQLEEKLEVAVENHRSDAAESIGRIEWVYGSQSGEIDARTALPPLSRTTVAIPIKSVDLFRSVDAKVSVHVARGKTAVASATFGFSPVMRGTPQLVEGEFRGLDKIPAIDLATSGDYKTISPQQVSGKMWMSWDDANLYIAARVLEPNHVSQKNPRWLQAGDCLGIGLQPGEPGEELGKSGADWYNLYAGTTDNGPAVFRESLPMDIMAAAHVQVERNQATHITSYLIALPWHSLQPLSPEHPLFSAVLTLNKNDGKGRPGYFSLGLEGWEEWGHGLNDFRLDRYQTLVLVR